jgi:hypothetical protein
MEALTSAVLNSRGQPMLYCPRGGRVRLWVACEDGLTDLTG